MNAIRTRLLCLVAVLIGLGPSAVHAQFKPQIEPSIMLGIPQGEFGDNVDNLGGGLSVFVGITDRQSPVTLGADLGFLIYGIERREEPFSTTIPDVVVDVETTNSIFLGHLLVRLQPPVGSSAIVPYAEGLFGFKYLFTETRIESDRSEEVVASSTNFDDFALSYGAGAGVQIRVYQGIVGDADGSVGKDLHIALNLGVQYLLGGEAEYLQKGSITRENGSVAFEVDRSKTALLIPKVGVAFRL